MFVFPSGILSNAMLSLLGRLQENALFILTSLLFSALLTGLSLAMSRGLAY